MQILKILKGIHGKCILRQSKNASQGNVEVAKGCETEKKPLEVRSQADELDVRRQRKYKKYALYHKKKRVRNKYMNRLKREFPDTWFKIKERTKSPCGALKTFLPRSDKCMNTQI